MLTEAQVSRIVKMTASETIPHSVKGITVRSGEIKVYPDRTWTFLGWTFTLPGKIVVTGRRG